MNVEQMGEALAAVSKCVHDIGCPDCPYRSLGQCKTEMTKDIANGWAEQMKFRRQMFNRCAALSKEETCDLCVYRDDCEKERG